VPVRGRSPAEQANGSHCLGTYFQFEGEANRPGRFGFSFKINESKRFINLNRFYWLYPNPELARFESESLKQAPDAKFGFMCVRSS
jgi:hypothetical protein